MSEPVEIGEHAGPFLVDACGLKTILKGLLQDERQVGTEDVAADRLVALVPDRSRREQRLHRPEHLFHGPEPLVGERHLGRRERGVRAQHPDSVVSRLSSDPVLVDGEGLPRRPQVSPIAHVSDQALLSPPQRLAQGRDDRLAV
ncbi:MAG: hypothetical protein KBB14_17625, partial [Thermoanaerobaculia bacterium]|nr:hypothetical protein [Thermoanaerobaculia bacterium]